MLPPTPRHVWISGRRSRPVDGISLLFALLVACAADRALVERFDQGNWQPAPFQIASLGGQRAGARVTFVLRLEGPAGRRLAVEGTVEIDPRATLVDGHFDQLLPPAGTMFWLTRKRLSGSYFAFTAARRS